MTYSYLPIAYIHIYKCTLFIHRYHSNGNDDNNDDDDRFKSMVPEGRKEPMETYSINSYIQIYMHTLFIYVYTIYDERYIR
jgi:hypothetical protein